MFRPPCSPRTRFLTHPCGDDNTTLYTRQVRDQGAALARPQRRSKGERAPLTTERKRRTGKGS